MNLRELSTLQIALGASIAVHAVLLTVRFVDPESFNRVFQDTPLEVVLVNANTKEKPDKAIAIAQASMAGGGDTENERASSPLPPLPNVEIGDALEQPAKRLQSMEEQQNILLATVRDQLAALPKPDPRPNADQAVNAEREEMRRKLISLLAEIERRINLQNSRPKKRYVSPATREEAYAVYYDHLKRSIEDKGTENFPTSGGRKLYGELIMTVEVNYDGQVLATHVEKSSGYPVLDRRAAAIVRSAGPFGRFTKDMRRQAEQIVVVSRFKFTKDETLEAKVSAPTQAQ